MDWPQLLKDILYVVITIIVPILAKYLVNFINAKAAEKAQSIESKYVADTLRDIAGIIVSSITTTTETFVKELKKNGSFTEESAQAAFNKTKELILSQLSEDAKELIIERYNDLDTYIRTQIEAILPMTKQNAADEN